VRDNLREVLAADQDVTRKVKDEYWAPYARARSGYALPVWASETPKTSSAGEQLPKVSAQQLEVLESLLVSTADLGQGTDPAEHWRQIQAQAEIVEREILPSLQNLITGPEIPQPVKESAAKKKMLTMDLLNTVAAADFGLRLNDILTRPAADRARVPAGQIQETGLIIFIEATDATRAQYEMASTPQTDKTGVPVSEIDAIKNMYGCEIRLVERSAISGLREQGYNSSNSIVVSVTPEGTTAFDASGFDKILNMQNFQQGQYFDFTSTAMFSKGWHALDKVGEQYIGQVRNLMSRIYARLTNGQPLPSEFFNNPAKFIIEIVLDHTPGVVYEEGELQDLHKQAWLTLIAA
jgi:hypothetical protein